MKKYLLCLTVLLLCSCMKPTVHRIQHFGKEGAYQVSQMQHVTVTVYRYNGRITCFVTGNRQLRFFYDGEKLIEIVNK